jgi:wyosine [tRNA(Phe)-imidazoG37] synthetase (radical SAM superfamily)
MTVAARDPVRGGAGATDYRYLFGPVASRRFGRSLGVDLTPGRLCSFDCRFCQLGRTRHVTIERGEWAPMADVLAELAEWQAGGTPADVISLAGSGEPTLHTGFGEVLRFVRDRTSRPAVLLSNGSLFWMPDVRRDAAQANVVKVSLSAWDQPSFERVNRPHPALRLEKILAGYRAFREEFAGELLLEVMLVQGENDAEADVRRIAALAASFTPTTVHLNTCVRPPAERALRPLDDARLEDLAALFSPRAETVATLAGPKTVPGGEPMDEAAVARMVARHPATAAQIACALGLSEGRVRFTLEEMIQRGLLAEERVQDGTFYRAKGREA